MKPFRLILSVMFLCTLAVLTALCPSSVIAEDSAFQPHGLPFL